jgi:pyridoxal phosphate enzyme (YggS family)
MSFSDIQKRIATACKTAGRDPASVTLVAVSKSQPIEKIEDVLKTGQRVFGENRVQEAEGRWPALREKHKNIELHFIGHLQTNKAKEAVALFDVIETVDSERLAAALKDEMERQGRNLPCLIQVNTGEEEQKGGVTPKALEKLHRACADISLDVRGLMCIPPETDIPGLHFALLRKLAGELGLPWLSMGMSADFETAIRYGATHVRVGSAVFGERVSVKR